MKDSDDVQRLIRLKRYESPGDEYFQTFREEFKVRQRSEFLQCSARGLLAERVTMWLGEINGGRWLIPAGAAAAAIAVGIYTSLPELSENKTNSPSFASSPSVAPTPTVEVINVQLPRPTGRVPKMDANNPTRVQGFISAGSKQSFREL